MLVKVHLTREKNKEIYCCTNTSLDLEEYVSGVVASEIGNAPLEACKAQAITARTVAYVYAMADKTLSDTTQAFRADRIDQKLYPNALLAAKETAGLILTYDGKPCSPCSYSDSNGGRTTSSQSRWGGYRAWLIEKDDPWDYAATKGKKIGHGVGMSQAGAKYAANIGYTCTDILSFYYPGTTITQVGDTMAKIQAATVVALAKEALSNNWGYIYGTSGQLWTQAQQDKLAKDRASDSNYTLSIQYGKKWIGHYVADCSGLLVYIYRKNGLTIYHSSQSQWDKSCVAQGELKNGKRTDGQELRPGSAVFKYKAGIYHPFHHVGIYVGDGKVIEASGSKAGVIESKITAWTHWGELKDVTYDEPEIEVTLMNEQMEVYATNGKSVNFRSTPTDGNANRIAQLPVGTLVTAIGTSGNYTRVTYNGKTGFILSSFLRAAIKNDANSANTNELEESTVSIVVPKSVAISLAAAIKNAGIVV